MFKNLKHLFSAVSLSSLALAISIASTAADKPDIKILTDQEVMSEHYLPDYSYAGYNNGVGEVPILEGREIDVTKYGVIADVSDVIAHGTDLGLG